MLEDSDDKKMGLHSITFPKFNLSITTANCPLKALREDDDFSSIEQAVLLFLLVFKKEQKIMTQQGFLPYMFFCKNPPLTNYFIQIWASTLIFKGYCHQFAHFVCGLYGAKNSVLASGRNYVLLGSLIIMKSLTSKILTKSFKKNKRRAFEPPKWLIHKRVHGLHLAPVLLNAYLV